MRDSHITISVSQSKATTWKITPPPGKGCLIYPSIEIPCACNITCIPDRIQINEPKCVGCRLRTPLLPPRRVRELSGGTHRIRRTLALTVKSMAREHAITLDRPQTVARINRRFLWMTKNGKYSQNLSMLDYYSEDWQQFPLKSFPIFFKRVAAELICPPDRYIYIENNDVSFH